MRPVHAALWLVVGGGLYLLAYQHGAGYSHCACHPSLPISSADLSLVPSTEREMVSCLLSAARARRAVRRRLYTCLEQHSYLASQLPADLALSPAIPPPTPLNAEASSSSFSSTAASATTTTTTPASPTTTTTTPASQALSSSRRAAGVPVGESPLAKLDPLPQEPADPLLSSLDSTRRKEEELPSAPLSSSSSPRPSQLPPRLAAAAEGSRLVLISCAANGRFFSLEAEKDWIECGGELGVTPIERGLFSLHSLPNEQLALKHTLTGKYLQVVPPGESLAWVVRAHGDTIGDAERFEIKPGNGESVYLYNVGAACHINLRFGFVLRGHGKPGRPAGKVSSARLNLRYLDLPQLRALYSELAAKELASRRPILEQLGRISSLSSSNEVRVISYGLYGEDTRYTYGVIRNAQLAPLVYPGWKVRVYLDRSVPRPIVAQLERLGAQLVKMDDKSVSGGIGGMFWRFLVASDPGVDRFIVRDSDSRLNPRERLAVEEWISSGHRIHSLRDHPNHDRPLNGGMWGGVRGTVPDMKDLVAAWSNRDAYMGDLDFLNQKVWPRIKGSQMSHDAYSCAKYPNARPFPTRRPPDFQHVGQVFFGDGRPRQGDITDFMLKTSAPRLCRGDPSWTHG